MPKIEVKGLPGLRGLDNDSYNDWKNAQIASGKISKKTGYKQQDRLYRNQQFVNEFGVELFHSMNAAQRDAFYSKAMEEKAIRNAYNEYFADELNDKDSELNEIRSPQAMRFLVENDYKTNKQRQAQNENEESYIKENVTSMPAMNNPISKLASAMFQSTKENIQTKDQNHIFEQAQQLERSAIKEREDIKNYRQQITNVAIQQAQESNEAVESIDEQYLNLLNTKINGVPLVPLYQAYKDSYQIGNISLTEKINALSMFSAIQIAAQNAPTEEEANHLFDSNIKILQDELQKNIHKNTTSWDKTKKTGRAIGTKFVSSLGELSTGTQALYYRLTDEDKFKYFIQGKDTNGEDLPWWNSMAYYSGMDNYNVWSPTEIEKIRENGGISQYTLLRDVGKEYKWFTTESFLEGTAMLGYAASSIALDYALTGGMGAAAKASSKAAMKSLLRLGVNAKNLAKARQIVNPVANFAGDLARINIHSVGESTLEGYMVGQEVLEKAKENALELMDSEEEKLQMQEELQERLNAEFPDGKDVFINSDIGFVSKKELRRKALQDEIYQEHLNKHLDAGYDAAAAAFATQATAMQLKNSTIDALTQTYLFAKPFATKIRPINIIDKSKVTIKNGVMEAKNYGVKDFAKSAIKTILGGAGEEFTDNVVHSGAVELGLNYYNNYLQHVYNGDTIGPVSLMENAFQAYLHGAENALYDDGTYLEAFIGGISPVTNVSPNVAGVASMISENNRNKLKQMTALEKINSVIYNPLLRTAVADIQEFEGNKEKVNAINKVLRDNGDTFKDVITNINLVEDFYENRDNAPSVDARDSKFNLAFQHIINMNKLAGSEGMLENFNSYLENIQKAAKGDVSDEMVEAYLNKTGNKNLAAENGKEKASATAREQIQKNAAQLLDLSEEYQTTRESIHDFSKGMLDEEAENQLVYQSMLSKNWKERVQEMEKGITGSTSVGTNTSLGQLNAYGAQSLQEEYNKKLELLSNKAKKYSNDAVSKKVKKLSKKYKEAVKRIETAKTSEKVLDANEILKLSPENRMLMLKNPGMFTEEQVEEINKAKNELALKDPDYMSKVEDVAILQQRIEENDNSFRALLDNPEKLVQYKNNLQVQALEDAVEFIKRSKFEEHLEKFDKLKGKKISDYAKTLSSEYLKYSIAARPEYSELLKPFVERASTLEGINATINNFNIEEAQKQILRDAVIKVTNEANTSEEVINALEDFIDNAGDSEGEITLREQMNEILDRAKDYNIVRNSAKVEARGDSLAKARKARETKDRRNQKAKERREKAKAEKERLKQEADAKAKGETMKGGKMEDVAPKTEVKTFESVEGEAIDLGEIEYSPNIEEVQTPPVVETTPAVEPEEITKEDTDLEPTSDTSTADQLRGNTLSPYNVNDLKEGVLKQKEATGWLKDFYDWMNNAGIKLQDIIDYELADIAKLNPVVHYMRVNPSGEATNDGVHKRHAFLVVEATDKVKKLHQEERGGIVKANDKDWLIIGAMGYAPNSNEQALWKNTLDKLAMRADAYFKNNPSERFEVDEKFETSIKKLALGRFIKQLESDTEVTYRSISELLNSPERNPYGLQWKDLSFAIQMATGGFELSRNLDDTVYSPKRYAENAGNVFLMIKASNGTYVPAAIKPTFTQELNPGALKDSIEELLMQLINTDHRARFDAVSNLKFLLNLNDTDNILIGTEKVPVISIKQNGVVVDTINLAAENLNRAEAFNKLKAARFRIQISRNNLLDIDRMKELDEAGALQTDIALLATAGGHYTVFASDMETGKPVDSNPLHTSANSVVRGSALNMAKDPSQLVDGKRVTKHNGIWTSESGKPVTDPIELQKIEMLNNIEENNIPVAYTDNKGYNMYIISESAENPVVARVDKSHHIEIFNGTNALNAIRHFETIQKNKRAKDLGGEEVNLGLDEIVKEDEISATKSNKAEISQEYNENSTLYIRDNGEIYVLGGNKAGYQWFSLDGHYVDTTKELEGRKLTPEEKKYVFTYKINKLPITKKETVSKEKTNKSKKFVEVSKEKTSEDLHNSKNLLTFVNIVTNPIFGKQVRTAFTQIAKEKGWALPSPHEMETFLKSKDIPMPSSMDKTAIDNWLEMIRNCK